MALQTLFYNRYSPTDKDLIYHYCNYDTLFSICKTKTIWLSDIYKMNDSSEFNWGRRKVVEVINKYQTEFSPEFRTDIMSSIFLPNFYLHPISCSFSKNGDLLNQWQDYAANGNGFSIGFSAKNIHERLGVNINSVIYSEENQEKIILDTLRGMFAVYMNQDRDFEDIVMNFCFDLAYLKDPYFSKEEEIRILRLLIKDGDSFRDPGGSSAFDKIPPLPIQNRKGKSDEIIYIALPFSPNEELFIKEIIIGPNNQTSIESLKELLNNLLLSTIGIKKSVLQYP